MTNINMAQQPYLSDIILSPDAHNKSAPAEARLEFLKRTRPEFYITESYLAKRQAGGQIYNFYGRREVDLEYAIQEGITVISGDMNGRAASAIMDRFGKLNHENRGALESHRELLAAALSEVWQQLPEYTNAMRMVTTEFETVRTGLLIEQGHGSPLYNLSHNFRNGGLLNSAMAAAWKRKRPVPVLFSTGANHAFQLASALEAYGLAVEILQA